MSFFSFLSNIPLPEEVRSRFLCRCFVVTLKIRFVVAFIFQKNICICCGASVVLCPLCPSCLQKLFSFKPFDRSMRCRVCGRELLSEKGLCMDCRRERVMFHTDMVFPVHSYHLWKKDLLFVWKYGQNRILSFVFAALIYQVLKGNGLADLSNVALVPVPPRPLKLKREGWDQIADICFFLHNIFGIKIVKILVRESAIPQKSLDRKLRLSSAVSAYTVLRDKRLKKIIPVIPRSILLLDDVITTGATLETCSVLLKNLGISQVYAISLFTAD